MAGRGGAILGRGFTKFALVPVLDNSGWLDEKKPRITPWLAVKHTGLALCTLLRWFRLCGTHRRCGRETVQSARVHQKAGTTAPLYFSSMNFFTSGVFKAAASFLMAALSLLSSRATSRLA